MPAGTPAPPAVTRDVEPQAVGDLLDHPPRAAVAFAVSAMVEVLPARAILENGVHHFGVQAVIAPDLTGAEVVLVRDDGPYWFELRGVTVRGIARPTTPPGDAGGAKLVWYVVEPRRILAWDYGALRPV
jgi:hypothetical protein